MTAFLPAQGMDARGRRCHGGHLCADREVRGGGLGSGFFVSLLHSLVLCHLFEQAFHDKFFFWRKFLYFFEQCEQVSIFKISSNRIGSFAFI